MEVPTFDHVGFDGLGPASACRRVGKLAVRAGKPACFTWTLKTRAPSAFFSFSVFDTFDKP